ncbi:pyroglutamyl-peptidase I [Arthrobacter agilis]|uniref:pyroglutamyl-peptidase I n=1 Tax=Arthrobacter agilis TaxID=37921 RepID=UPI000B358A50|nr:pyroglutamyl-peptidase I [Arthrobacter agilis]OUM40327.1 pyroglutamyl-peptidase I [Arthrobacter agilis]PPB44940.1 pyroglutamyl-peptidase I [Arthrobacter agilis]TPV27645.1 pyroglutamyl-peptidase I [Arthrobacter agilis]VDR31731.1 Pyrrolidone-carboxylate peptidase [Arthrobacter agilis]
MILLTGFEPFGGETTNPSWLAAQQATILLRAQGLEAAAVEVPCVFGRSVDVLTDAMDRHRPDVVLCLGQAGGRERVSVERVAINIDDARIPDNAGRRPVDDAVVPDGPAAYFSTLPIKACREAVAALGVPVEVSQTAGTYVCNHLFYGLMHRLAGRSGTRGGFVHVPYSTEQAEANGAPGLPVGDMAAALAAIATTTARTPVDVRVSAGAEH